MEGIGGVLIFIGAIVIIANWHQHHDEPQTAQEQAVVALINAPRDPASVKQRLEAKITRSAARRKAEEARAKAHPKRQVQKPSAAKQDRPAASGNAVELIRTDANAFDVPAGQIFGHWTAESGRLETPYGFGDDWLTVRQLGRGGACARRYSRAKGDYCEENAKILVAICEQIKPDGQPVCDLRTVRLSVGYAMGPMQIVPSTLAYLRDDGSLGWTRVAVDSDRDGIIDPFSLPDSFASAAKLIRIGFDRYGNSLGAIDRYYGGAKTKYRARVIHGWREWCGTYGCGNGAALYAAK